MSTNDLTLTLIGWAATEPKLYTGPSTTFTSFRMASTRRYFDRAQNSWVDGRTEWFTVKCWRQQAMNAASSLRKSDPIIVHGRLSTEEWTGTDGARTSLVLEAIAIGPDLTYGRAQFARTVHLASTTASTPGSGPGAERPELHGVENGEEAPGEPEGPGYPASDDPWSSAGLLRAGTADDAEALSKDELEEEESAIVAG